MGKAFNVADSFLIRNPLGQPGVVQEVEAGVRPVDLLPTGYYADNEVRCSFCTQRQAHRRGYFAVLPDGALALCGNCCAIKIAGKETVGAIDRRRNLAASGLKRKEAADRLTAGLPAVMEALEDGPLHAEATIRKTLQKLHDVFGGSGYVPDAMISHGAGGLKSVLKAVTNDNFSEKDVPALMQKKAKAISLIKSGVEMLPERRRLISYPAIGEFLKETHARNGWVIKWNGQTIEYRKVPDAEPRTIFIEPLHVDIRRVKAILSGM
ncbi:hypothetical protein [Paracoccus ravus]|uniref:hypothetical protein n=1 Tax=Paracoccus ravus TaxID=2447760 RepID=UPI00106EBEE9|nr:hypothetical protein [Paracoccus ravus]